MSVREINKQKKKALPSQSDSWKLIILHARLALPSSLFLHICCSSTDGLCSEMICEEMLSRPLLACLRVQLVKDRKRSKTVRLAIGWFLCQVSPISSVVSHPLSLCKQLLPLKLASQLHCRYTLVKFVRGAKSTGRKRKALVPSASDVTLERKKFHVEWHGDNASMLFFYFFCSCSEDETRRPLIFVGNTKTEFIG